MSNEIKEAIMQFQTAIDFKEAPMPMDYSIDLENAKILLDYITWLQQRVAYLERSNNRREENITSLQDECTELEQENERLKERLNRYNKYTCLRSKIMLDDYKSRVEKAIEYIKEQDMSYYGAVVETKMDIILTLLQGGKDE